MPMRAGSDRKTSATNSGMIPLGIPYGGSTSRSKSLRKGLSEVLREARNVSVSRSGSDGASEVGTVSSHLPDEELCEKKPFSHSTPSMTAPSWLVSLKFRYSVWYSGCSSNLRMASTMFSIFFQDPAEYDSHSLKVPHRTRGWLW